MSILTLATLALIWPVFFIPFGKGLANFRNWHFAIVALAMAIFVGKKSSPSGFLTTKVPLFLWTLLTRTSLVSLLTSSLLTYYAISLNGMDFSIFDWMLYNSNHRNFMTSPVCDGCNHMGIHTSWVMWPIVPLHRLLESPLLLQCVQVAAIWLGQFPLRRMAMALTDCEPLAFIVTLAYLSNSWVGSIVNHGFHFEVFFIVAGLFMLDGWTRERPWTYLLGLICFLATKEDGAFYTLAFSVGALVSSKPRVKLALFTMAMSLLTAWINFAIAQPYFLHLSGISQPRYLGRFWGRYGETKSAIVAAMIAHPSWVVKDVFTGGWSTIFGSMLFLPLFSLHAAIAFIPFLLINGTASSDDQQMRDYAFYYSAPLLPFLFWGLLSSYPNVTSITQRLAVQLKRRVSAQFSLGTLALGATFFGLSTGGYQRFPAPDFQALRDLESIRESNIGGSGAPICAQLALFPHLPYQWNLEPLYQECLTNPLKLSLLAPPYDPNPHTVEVIRVLIEQGELIRKFPSGITLVRGVDVKKK